MANDWIIYVIGAHSDGPFKIGKSRQVKNRLHEFQIASPDKLSIFFSADIPAASVENLVHDTLRPQWLRGEWFRVSLDDAKRAIAAAIAATPKPEAAQQPAPEPPPPPALSPVILVNTDLIHRVTIEGKFAEDRRIQWERDAPKRALVARLAEGKRKAAAKRKADHAKLQAWLDANRLP